MIYALEKFLPISYYWAKILPPPPQAHPYPGAIFLKMKSLHPWVQGKPPTKNKVDWLNAF